MTDAEKMMLSDAIETAIEEADEKIAWRRLAIVFLLAIIILSYYIVAGG